MPNDSMTLIERLRNPAWEADGSAVDAKPARLNVAQTLRDMKEAADEIESLRKQFLDGVSTILDKVRRNEEILTEATARIDRTGL